MVEIDNVIATHSFAPEKLVDRILDRDDLGMRSESYHSAAAVLLWDAKEILSEVADAVFEEQAVTQASLQSMRDVAQKLQDAICLAAFCPTEPVEGIVTILPDGTRRGTATPTRANLSEPVE